MEYIRLFGADIMQSDAIIIWAVTGLTVLSVCLLGIWYGARHHTARIYNWNGRRYCYMGHARLHQSGGGYRVYIGERMADLSYTTLYQICLPKKLVRRSRYKGLVLCAGKAQCMMHVEECMRESVYYR